MKGKLSWQDVTLVGLRLVAAVALIVGALALTYGVPVHLRVGVARAEAVGPSRQYASRLFNPVLLIQQ